MPKKANLIDTLSPPFETAELREQLALYLDQEFSGEGGSPPRKIGNFKWGVNAFFDYDGEPVYVGQTKEFVRTRIRRHLTNQRTDAVAMSVLDPFEVAEIEVWPLPQFQETSAKNKEAMSHLDALERAVYECQIEKSQFKAVLNEKNPPVSAVQIAIPKSHRGRIVSEAVLDLRDHPDLRIARRSLILSRLAQVISERKVQAGLRRVLLVQARRLAWLAEQRFSSLGGDASVPEEGNEEDDDEPDAS